MTTVSGVIRNRDGDIFLPQTDAALVSGLSTVATSGSYTDLNNKPTLATVATSGSYNDLSNKPDLTGFITNSVNNLTNYYLKTETYTQTEIQNLIGAINQFSYQIAASTSAISTPASNVLYLIGPTGSGADKYEEYVYANSTWTKIGDTSVDLSGYVTTTALNTALADYALSSTIPTALSDLTDDSTHRTVTDTEKGQWMPRIYIGTCGTSAGTVNKIVTVESFPLDGNGKPLVGTMIGVKFTNTNSATAPKLNVNETGAASIWYNSDTASSTSANYGGSAARYCFYVWDGTYWVWVTHGTDNNDNALAYNVRYNSASKTTIDKFARYRILFTSADDAHWVPANTSTSTNATASRTVNQTPINPFGQIVYYGSTTAISAGGTPGASVLYTQYALTFGYSFNRTGAALTLTTKAPVYIKCAPQSNGSAIIDSNTPYVQTLPSTEDGKIYIYLGVASSATAVEMSIVHPVYYYKDGLVRPWTNVPANSELTLTTWQNLVNLRNNNQLIPGHQYRITDYECGTIHPNTRSAGHRFDIIVTATSDRTLDENAKAAYNASSDYHTSNISGWELKYELTPESGGVHSWAGEYGKKYINTDVDGITSFVRDESADDNGYYGWYLVCSYGNYSGDAQYIYTTTESPTTNDSIYDSSFSILEGYSILNVIDYTGKGLIYYMKDEFNNVAYYDFKNIQFKRTLYWHRHEGYDDLYYLDTTEHTLGSEELWLYTYSYITNEYNTVNQISDATNTWAYNTSLNSSAYVSQLESNGNNYIGPFFTFDWSGNNFQMLNDCVIACRVDASDSYMLGFSNVYRCGSMSDQGKTYFSPNSAFSSYVFVSKQEMQSAVNAKYTKPSTGIPASDLASGVIPTVGTLNTNNTTAQTASSSESLSGTVNLHKVSKTGAYSDLIGAPDLTNMLQRRLTVQDITALTNAQCESLNLGDVVITDSEPFWITTALTVVRKTSGGDLSLLGITANFSYCIEYTGGPNNWRCANIKVSPVSKEASTLWAQFSDGFPTSPGTYHKGNSTADFWDNFAEFGSTENVRFKYVGFPDNNAENISIITENGYYVDYISGVETTLYYFDLRFSDGKVLRYAFTLTYDSNTNTHSFTGNDTLYVTAQYTPVKIQTYEYDPNDPPYGWTIVNDILTGNTVVLEYSDNLYRLNSFSETANGYSMLFICSDSNTIYSIQCDYNSNSGVSDWDYQLYRIPDLSIDVESDLGTSNKATTPDAVFEAIHPTILTTQTAGGMLPNVMYNLGTLTGTVTFSLASPTDNTIVNHYYWTFTAGSTAPTITWPSGITWASGSAPIVTAGDYYEISVYNGIAMFMNVTPSS